MKQRVTELRVTLTGKLCQGNADRLAVLGTQLRYSLVTKLSENILIPADAAKVEQRQSKLGIRLVQALALTRRPRHHRNLQTAVPQALRHPADRFLGFLLRTLLNTKQEVHIGGWKQLSASETSDRAHGNTFIQLRIGSHLFIPESCDQLIDQGCTRCRRL